jgi:uncharacterized protein DUF4190
MTINDPQLIQPGDPQWLKNAAKPRADADGAAIGAIFGAFLLPPLGIILGHVSRGQAKRHGLQPSAIATLGCILGYVFTVIAVIGIIVIVAAAAKSGSYADCVNNAILNNQDPSTCTP